VVNSFPPESDENISSALGRGYDSVLDALLTISLKSPQMRIDPLDLITGTIGAGHSAVETFSMTPVCLRRSNSLLTFSLRAYGTSHGW